MAKKAKKAKAGKRSKGRPGPTPKARAAYNKLIRKSFKRLHDVLEKKDPAFVASVVG